MINDLIQVKHVMSGIKVETMKTQANRRRFNYFQPFKKMNKEQDIKIDIAMTFQNLCRRKGKGSQGKQWNPTLPPAEGLHQSGKTAR